MANRSYLYLKNEESTRILCEGIYQIPLFWQCLWSEKELEKPFAVWAAAYLDNDEIPEEYSESDQLDILISLDAYRRHAHGNRGFVEQVFPDQLALYNQFLAYIEANIAEGDVLGTDVSEIVEMGEPEETVDELLQNQQAIHQKNPALLGPNVLSAKDIFADFTGYTDYYLETLSENHRLVTSDVAMEKEKTASLSDVKEETQSVISPSPDTDSQQSEKSWKWFGLIIAVIVILKRYFFS